MDSVEFGCVRFGLALFCHSCVENWELIVESCGSLSASCVTTELQLSLEAAAALQWLLHKCVATLLRIEGHVIGLSQWLLLLSPLPLPLPLPLSDLDLAPSVELLRLRRHLGRSTGLMANISCVALRSCSLPSWTCSTLASRRKSRMEIVRQLASPSRHSFKPFHLSPFSLVPLLPLAFRFEPPSLALFCRHRR